VDEMIGVRAPSRETAIDADDKLIAAAQEGDVEAFGLLYERYKGIVFSFVLSSVGRREDAEDIVQEVFCNAWRAIGRFRGESRLSTWLIRIAVNACTEHARRVQRRSRFGVQVDLDSPGVESAGATRPGPESRSLMKEATREALQALPAG